MSEKPKQSEATEDSEEKPESEDTPTPSEETETPPTTEELLALERKHVEELETRLAYQQAEHANAIKTLERRRAQFMEQSNRDLLLKLLPVLDDLELSFLMVPMVKANKSYIEGLKMVLVGFQTTLRAAGVTRIKCEGQSFDPLRHEVISREETTEYPPNTIIEELRKGYLLKGKLLRTSLVKIAVAPKTSEEETEQQPEETEPSP